MNLFQSKTNNGLYLILALSIALAFAGKLTPEMVEVIKFVGGFFFGVRAVANYAENKA